MLELLLLFSDESLKVEATAEQNDCQKTIDELESQVYGLLFP